jgi:hypothetical protein
MHGHTLVQVIHTGLLPLKECHYRFPVPSWSCYFKNESLLCYSSLQYTKPGFPPCIVFGTTFACSKGGSWINYEYGALMACDWQRKIKILKEKCPSGTLYTTNPTWTGLSFVMDNVTWDILSLQQDLLYFPPVSVIPPMLHTHSIICHRH